MSKLSRIILITIFLFIALFSSGCGPNRDIVEEEAIYRYILRDIPETKPVVLIRDHTYVRLSQDTTLRNDTPSGVDEETRENFIAKNEASHSMRTDMNLGNEYVLISKNEMDVNRDRDVFSKKYPNSSFTFSFSRVGFNEEYTQALIYYEFWSPIGEAGGYCVFEKEHEAWVLHKCPSFWKT